MAWGYETRGPGSDYHWEGGRRGLSTEAPRVLFQYTLAGRGEYGEGEERWKLESEVAFTVLLPSKHCYYLPPRAGPWTFFWFIVQHPFVVERMRELRRKEAAVQKWEMGSPALEAAARLFEGACQGRLRDAWSFEERLIHWLLQTERELHQRRYPPNERERLLDATRRTVRDRLQHPPTISELAEASKLERTTFSRKFKAGTGLSPAAFVTEVRLEEALRLLRTEAKLEQVAEWTGFADANHFCKVFRRHFHTSPGNYRRLIIKDKA